MKCNAFYLWWLCVTLAVSVSAGCAGSTTSIEATNDNGTASSSIVPTSPPSIPAAFPVLTEFTPVNPEDYRDSYPYFNGINFRTPGGQTCDHNSMNSLADAENKVVSCIGPSAGRVGNWSVDAATKHAATIEEAAAPGNPDYQPREEDLPKFLPAMHKITYESITCAAGNDGLTACQVGAHGFVLTPTSTTLF
ncbi:hypothetical protein [Mycobacterium sp. NPDC004974]